MHLSKEVKIGVLVATTVTILLTGFYLLKGADLFSNENEYYCYYANIDGLINSSPVQLKGMNVGHISNIELAGARGVKVTVVIGKKIELPRGTVAGITSTDILGGKVVRITPGPGPGIVNNKEELLTATEGGPVDNITGELTPRLKELKGTIISLDTALAGINQVVGTQNQQQIAMAIRSITITADNLAKLSAALTKETGEIGSIVHNANSVTGNLAQSNDTIKHILSNLNSITHQLAQAPIQQTLANMQSATDGLQGIVKKINSSDGSLGLLINNKDMYNNLNSTIVSLRNLTDDLKAHPARYVHVSVFGKKSN